MPTATVVELALAFLLVAALYSSVGHAGASGYLAVMALFGVVPEVMKPTALALNVVVASLGAWRFARAGHFSWRLFWPFGAATIPCAFFAGRLQVDAAVYKPLLGGVLLLAAVRLFTARSDGDVTATRPPPIAVGLGVGAAIGFLSGLTGTGGGIFLSPLALFRRWTTVRQTSALSAVFILVTSISGLAGLGTRSALPLADLPWFVAAVIAGALAGTQLGAHKLDPRVLRRLLAVVLVIAGGKLLLGV